MSIIGNYNITMFTLFCVINIHNYLETEITL